ncbi:MAG: hypothetical protein L6R40_006584 [Gallowayella cf. fulva]|nr:MAG: hypothetical protein L6R40_006584 [Xanthomendoza cf. fulva]
MAPNLVTSQDFARPNLPRHSSNGSKRSRASSVHSPSVRLSIIEEDAASHPPMPPRAHHRPFHRRWNLGDPPRSSFESPPPKYSVWDTLGPKGEKLGDVRNNRHIARRGGWRRICLIMLILLTLVVGLAVGLSIGLHKRNSSTPTSPQPAEQTSTSSSAKSSPFPAGSYTLTTHLSTNRTECTSNATLWSCFPYQTYNPSSPTSSLANFTWIITPSSSSKNNDFTISSTNNPFSINFPSTPLTILSPNTPEERYTFTTTLDKTTFPAPGQTCYFNATTLQGTLYTKKPKNYPAPLATTTATAEDENENSDAFQPWPYAVDIQQTIAGGDAVPQCFRSTANGNLGDRMTEGISPRPESATCACEWRNFGA